MNALLVGYGKMGKSLEQILISRGHSVVEKFNSQNASELDNLDKTKLNFDLIFDFTGSFAFCKNYALYLDLGKPVVVGTTGWEESKDRIIEKFRFRGVSIIYGANFSIGVNAFLKCLRFFVEILKKTSYYEAVILETHHSQKKDSPSGTAKKMKSLVEDYFPNIQILSARVGSIFGNHAILLDSQFDTIELIHQAKSREGFAIGAVLAGEYLLKNPGVYEFEQVFDRLV
ncbi:MAG: hypothetical protein NZO16_04765 [Deltaproteobacteria bacterium]|nr:hypothetical protein [Deltaproteobacteria bacterium]